MINSDIYNLINQLSDNDTKTLGGKGLKLAEECGELSSKILPYESAAGTKHRFVTRDKIAEEVADVILVALSIARELKLTPDEINHYLNIKSEKWAMLQAGELKDDIANNRIPFELHVTITPISDPERFKRICLDNGTKGIILELHNNNGEIFQDWMTSSRILGSNKTVLDEADRIAKALKNTGYEIVRTKIETVAWHPAISKGTSIDLPSGNYFESHIGIIVSNDIELDKIKETFKSFYDGFYFQKYFEKIKINISGNASKIYEDGTRLYMITLRSYIGNAEEFKSYVKILKSMLADENIPTQLEVIEYAIYDSNPDHDDRWLND